MNGVQPSGAFPANTVLRLSNSRPMTPMNPGPADEVLLAAVTHPPRIGEARPIAALMPQVLARYGIAKEAAAQESTDESAVDLLV